METKKKGVEKVEGHYTHFYSVNSESEADEKYKKWQEKSKMIMSSELNKNKHGILITDFFMCTQMMHFLT